MARYQGDPRWIKARFESNCECCGKRIAKGENLFYFPNGKTVYCDSDKCGGQESRNFEAARFDEDF